MTDGGSRRGGGRSWRALGLSAVALLVLLVAALAALHLPAVQRLLFDRATAAVESRSGLRLAAGSVRLRPLAGRLELGQVSLAAGGVEPFLTVRGLAVAVAPGSLVRGPLVVREVVLEGPRFDGGRPLPEPPAAAAGPATPPRITIERLELRDGAAVGLPLPAALAPHLDAVSIEGLEAGGRLAGGQLRLAWRLARLAAMPAGRQALAASLEGEIAGPVAGPLELERLELAGDGLSLDATGRLGLAADQPLAVELEAAADLPRLLGVEAAAEPLRLGGRVDLRAMDGELRLEAAGLPAELARPWLDAALFESAGLAGSHLRLVADLGLRQGELGGSGEVRWLGAGGGTLAAAKVGAAGGPQAAEIPLDLRLELLPARPGRRTLEARLRLPRQSPAAAVIEDGRLRLELPDLERELAALSARWPAWVPALPPGLAAGPVRARGWLQGGREDLALRLEGAWAPAPGASVRFEAAGVPLARRLRGRLRLERVPLERFVDGASGALAGSADLRLAGQRLAAELAVEGSDLALGGLEVRQAQLTAALDGRRLRLHELAAEAPGRSLRLTGEADLGADPGADLGFELTGDWGPVAAAEGRLRLAAGVLRLDVERAAVGGAETSLAATAPVATLARLPGAEALAELALAGAEGPLEVAWTQPAVDWAPLLALQEGAAGGPARRWLAGASGRLTFDPASPAAATGEAEITALALEQEGHTLRAPAPLRLTLADGRLELAPATVEVDGRPLEVSATARLDPGWSPGRPPEELVAEARIAARAAAAEPLEELDAALLLQDGRLELAVDAHLRDGGRGRLEAAAPLAALAGDGEGLVELSWQLPATDWSGWLAAAGEERAVTRLVAATTGELEVDPRRPALAAGALRIPRFEADLGDQTLRAEAPLELLLGEGRLVVGSARLLASGTPLELSGWIDLDPAWAPGGPPAELVREVALRGGGVVPAALLNPFLAGGVGEGTLLAELEIAGPRQEAHGKLRLAGADAGFFFASPYTLEVAAPELDVRLEGGAATFTGAARVNEGRLDFSGAADPESGVGLEARLEGVRAVLDYGLLTLLDGDLRLTLAPEGTGRLAGRLTVDRGQLTRSIRLDSLLLDQLLPADLLGSELDPLEAIELDLTLATRQGVRVKNNLADLKVRWEPVTVRGNLVRPVIEGRLEVDPGGLVYAYGQTLRLDSAAVVYQGLPDEVPTMELEATTSFEDPSIGRLAGNDPFAVERGPGSGRRRRSEDDEQPGGARTAAGEALTTGLTSFLGEQLSSSIGEALGGTRISFRPLLVFGEADPGARLSVASDVSPHATLAASIDLRNAERQTYLLDLHDERAAARLSAQLFTNDLGNEGGMLQQRLEFGRARRQATGPRLRRLRIDRVAGVGRRALKRAVGYREGDRLSDGAAFEISVAVGELLRRRGYPDARVRVVEGPPPGRPGVALEVRVDSGPHVEYRFTGGQLPRGLRRAVAELYRGDFYEPVAIEEMRLEAVRAWRSRGHLEPRVTVAREVLAAGPPERRQVTVDSQPGDRVELEAPRFVGLPPAEAAELAALFGDTLRRVELAAGLEAAERRALQGLAALGWPQAALVGRSLSPDRRQLTVEVAPGERLRVAALELRDARGVGTEVGEAGGMRAGEPLRTDRLSRAALAVEVELRAAGFLDAELTVQVEPPAAAGSAERRVIFAVDRGPVYRLAETEFSGLGATRPAWARRTAGLPEGRPLAPAELREARRRLYGTGLFSAVGSSVEIPGEAGARVRFEVEEEARFRLAYGLRWESEEGASLVLDALDRNLLGRGVDLGLRALWSEDIQQLRLSGSLPDVVGRGSRLELFALASDEVDTLRGGETVDKRTAEATVQLGWPLGRRTTGRVYGRYRDGRSRFEEPLIGTLEVRTRRPFLGLQYIFDSRDDRVATGRGLFASLDFSFSDDSIGGDIRYGRLFGQLHSFRPAGRLAGRRLTWAQSVRLGRGQAFSGQQLADDLLLLAGGEYSVRGYRRESLGPPSVSSGLGVSTEHNSLLVLNEELRFEIWDLLSGLVFLDAGNVWLDDDSDLELFKSLGIGLRAETPFGLMRLDAAWPLDRREGIDPEYKIYFGLGNVF